MGNLIRVLALLLLASPVVYCENLGQLRSDTRILALDAASGSRQRFSDSAVNEFLNQGQRQMISETRCIRKSLSFALSAGSTYYALPSSFIRIRRVTRATLNLTELSPEALDSRSRGWEGTSGAAVYYFVNFSTRGYIGFAPYPQSSSDIFTVKVEFDASADELSSDSDIPFNGIGELYPYHHFLNYYAAGQMMLINGLQNQAQAYIALFTAGINSMKANCTDRVNFLPSAVSQP